jgi:hypothetical protein
LAAKAAIVVKDVAVRWTQSADRPRETPFAVPVRHECRTSPAQPRPRVQRHGLQANAGKVLGQVRPIVAVTNRRLFF